MRLDATLCNFGWQPPPFDLPGFDGVQVSLDEVKGINGTLIAFICNHCPYVRASIGRFVADARILQDSGIGICAIMSNDYATYPADAPENMKRFAQHHDFSFPYLVDEDQAIAHGFEAQCTPEYFGFNSRLELQYHGRLDESRIEENPNAKRDLLDAMLNIAKTGTGPAAQMPSMGCSIKWRT